MNIVVTGGAGFIGSEFVRALLSEKYNEYGLSPRKLIVVDALTYAADLDSLKVVSTDPRFTFIKGDIQDLSLMQRVTKNCNLLVNFAAESHVDRSIHDASSFVSTNVLGVQSILEAARVNEIGCTINVSTDEVYGSISAGSSDENSLLMPNSPYSASKASGDLLARSYFQTYGTNVITTRCTNNFGIFQNAEKLIPTIITNLNKGFDIPVYGDGLNVREWITVGEHAKAIAFVSQHGNPGEIYNIGSGLRVTNLNLIKTIIEIFGRTSSAVKFIPDRLGHDFRYSINSDKLKKLGFSANFDFLEELKNTIRWYRSK